MHILDYQLADTLGSIFIRLTVGILTIFLLGPGVDPNGQLR
ncbi:MAG: hypothetical protein AAGD01_08105 [Acidobacteriota bacterium]